MVEALTAKAEQCSVLEVAAVLLSVPALICLHRLSIHSLAKHWQELAVQFLTVVLPTLDVLLESKSCILSLTALCILRVWPSAVRLQPMTEDQARKALRAVSSPRKRYVALSAISADTVTYKLQHDTCQADTSAGTAARPCCAPASQSWRLISQRFRASMPKATLLEPVRSVL